MTISENKIYPRTGDTQTVYLKNVITNNSIKINVNNLNIILPTNHNILYF